ncbi:hypothetical protein BsWGS_17527 [Bradybaena similaris]
MADFIAEIKPRSFYSERQSSFQGKDFVAEIRPRSVHQTSTLQTHALSLPHDDSDMCVQKMLNDRNFTRDGLTRLLEGSLVTLVETLLAGRNISKIEGTLCISFHGNECPVVVNLQKRFPEIATSKWPAEVVLENCLNVKVKARDNSSILSLPRESPVVSCSQGYEFERDPCNSPTDPDSRLPVCSVSKDERFTPPCPPCNHPPSPVSKSISSTTSDSNLSSVTHEVCSASPSPKPDRETHEEQLGYPVNDSPMNRESDGESGYVSNDKEDQDLACVGSEDENKSCFSGRAASDYTDYFCSGLDDAETRYMSMESPASDDSLGKQDSDSCGSSAEGSDELDDDADEDWEHRLVIDENAINDLKSTKVEEPFQEVDHREKCCRPPDDVTVVSDLVNVSPLQKHVDEEEEDGSMTVDSEEVDPALYLGVADTNSCRELPGNSGFSGDQVSGAPHPKSIMSKHLGGFTCKQCMRTLADSTSASAHVLCEHELHLCSYCCRTFTAKNNLKRHVRRHTGQKPYKCSHCPKSFFRRDDLKGHMIRHEYSKPFHCCLCKKGYTDRACVKNHMAKEHGSRLMHVCPLCGESFASEQTLSSHKATHPELQQFACDTCSFIGSNNLMALKHNLLHSHKLFSCKPCNAHFADPFHYTNHIRKHKHMASFTQFVCCFCDLVLGTYEQFVRHEYSHAQCKIHACTICRKQFRSKLLLQDHLATHKQLDEVMTGEIESETMETERAHWAGEQKRFLQTDTNLQPVSVHLIGHINHCSTEDTLADPIQPENDEFYGQLLDLSMKKPSSPTFTSSSCNIDHNQTGNCNISIRATGTSVNDGSRNGARSSDPAGLTQECGTRPSGLAFTQSVKATTPVDKAHVFMFNSLANISTSSDLGIHRSHILPGDKPTPFVDIADSYALSDLPLTSRPRHAEGTHGMSGATSDKKVWHAAALNRLPVRHPLLFSPYSRDKVADLAAKFMVARGNKLVSEKGRVKFVVGVSEEEKKGRSAHQQSTAHKQQPTLESAVGASLVKTEATCKSALLDRTAQAHQENDNVVSEYSNLETTLRCHIPTVVKSEPLKEQDENAGNPLDFRFRALKAEEAEMRCSVGGRHSCDVCRETFGTFLQLEDHSVEVHKRYLCEHCKKGFTARPNRDRHVRYHTGERPYKCDLCDLAFFRGDDLKYHRTTRHPTAQPFVCSRCSASFTWGRDLERHIRHSKCKV